MLHTCSKGYCKEGVTEKNILTSAIIHPNQQCFVLLKHLSSIAGLNPSFYDKCRVTHDGCAAIYDTMRDTLTLENADDCLLFSNSSGEDFDEETDFEFDTIDYWSQSCFVI